MNFSLPNLFANLRTKSVEITLILLFVIWTPLLINSTLQIQHSCYPLIKVSQLPDICKRCPDGTKPPCEIKPKLCSDGTNPPCPIIIDPHPDPVLIAGTGAVIIGAGLAIAGAPLLVVAGIGASSYFVIKSILEQLN
ncbi:hypothetical protein ACN4EE_13245 [Geminocystis sp. CENA526]|uniref:hypothetical protein n=1 Tax=Geminocystis sp. CENA526 TaxID=1355871 RepID=UPI003D6EB545